MSDPETAPNRPSPNNVGSRTPDDQEISRRPPLLARTEVPFLVTLLFALLGWGLSQAVDRVSKRPILKYTVDVEEDVDLRRVQVALKNIMSDVNFKNFKLQILGADPAVRFSELAVTVPRGPPLRSSLSARHDSIDLDFDHFPPRSQVRLTALMEGDGKPQIHILESEDPMLLEPRGLPTWIVEWELHILSLIVIMACGLLLLWWIKRK